MLESAKTTVRAALGAPGIRHGLRWLIQQPSLPRAWRELAHRKLAKAATFRESLFSYVTPAGTSLRFLHRGTANHFYWRNEYEPETTSLFCRLASRSNVILDIGAAQGIYSILAAATNPSATILAFEPTVDAAEACAHNLELNLPITRNVELIRDALGPEDAESILYVSGDLGGTSSLNPSFRERRTEQRVAVRKGDSVLEQRKVPRVDLIKIDTESTEPAVLRGLATCLRRDRPDVVCEVLQGRTERDLEQLLRPLGYRFFWISETGLVERETIEGDATYRYPNYLFTVRTARDVAGAPL